MSKEELESKIREMLIKAGKPQNEIDKVVSFLLDLPSLQTNENRLAMFKQWSDTL